MAKCRDCIHDEVCGEVQGERAELCEAYVNKEIEKSKNAAAECNVEDCAWAGRDPLMELVNGDTALKIKAAGYDAIKAIVGEYMQYGDDECETLAIIDGIMRMEEAVTKALIK